MGGRLETPKGASSVKDDSPPAEGPSSTPSYPPVAAAFVANEAGGRRRKPGIKENRMCQDIVFLVAFLLAGVGFIAETSFGFNRGNPGRLVHGLDYKGNLCGNEKSSPNVKALDIQYWVNPNQLYQSGLRDARSICLRNCPTPGNNTISWVCDYPDGSMRNLSIADWSSRNYDYFELLTPDQITSSKNLRGPCYPVLFLSTNVFWRCQISDFPQTQALQVWKSYNGTEIVSGNSSTIAIERALSSSSATLERYIADLGKAWPVLLLCGGLVPLLLCITWLVLIRYFVAALIWITIALLNILALVVTIFFYVKVHMVEEYHGALKIVLVLIWTAGWFGNDAVTAIMGDNASNANWVSSSEQRHLKVVAVFVTLVFILIVLCTVSLSKRIAIAVAVLKEALGAIAAIPSLLIYPLLPFLIMAAFLIYWVVAVLFLFSAGEVRKIECGNTCSAYDLSSGSLRETSCCGFQFLHSRSIVWGIIYHLFSLFWTTQFILACSVTTIAGAVASHYWARGETAIWNGGGGMDWKGMGWLPVFSSAKLVLHYSLGSMALGSLVVAPVEMIQLPLNALRRKLKAGELTMPGGQTVNTLGWSSRYCLGCLEWTLNYINRKAYIVIAISGKNFWGASGKATRLIAKNALRVGTVSTICDIVLTLGKGCVSFACALFAFLMLDMYQYKGSHKRVASPLFPVLFCWGAGYLTASIFFGVVEMAVDTILISFCMDSEEHSGTPLFAPQTLVETLNNFVERQEAAQAAQDFRRFEKDDEEDDET